MGLCTNQSPQVLFITSSSTDSEPFHHRFSLHGYTVILSHSGAQALEQLKNGRLPWLVLLDIRSSGAYGLDILQSIRQMTGSLPVVVITTPAQTRAAVLAMQYGANAFLPYPFDDAELESFLMDLQQRYPGAGSAADGQYHSDFVSINHHMLQIKDIIRQVACTDVPVLLQGESGVGKEVVARYLHEQSEQRHGPFIKVNCAALSTELIETELFGHERGSFTGAIAQKTGKFELADGGTLFLDEISELSLPIQAKLLHVLQDGRFFKVGGSKYITSDARIVVATNKVLKEAVQADRFRQDLYFRLNVIDICIPPLRERKEDIPLLCAHFLKKYAHRYHRERYEVPSWILDVFKTYDWPGNVRELENVMRRLLVLHDEHFVLHDIMATVTQNAHPSPTRSAAPMLGAPLKTLREQSRLDTSRAERDMILQVLGVNKWNRKKAAAQLGISYKTLLNKLEKWDLRPPS